MIAGLEVEKEHCSIENTSESVTLTPVSDALCSVNGSLVEETTKLTQGTLNVYCQSKFVFEIFL